MPNNPMISIAAALALVGAKSIEDAPFKKGVSWEAGRTLNVTRSVNEGGWYGIEQRTLARLRFSAAGVEVVFAVPSVGVHKPAFVAAVEALRAEVALLPPPEPCWTIETGSSSDSGWWSALTAPDGRRWAILERNVIPGISVWGGVVPGPMVAPEGTLEVAQPATMKGDYSSGPFSKTYPAYKVSAPVGATDFMRYVSAWTTSCKTWEQIQKSTPYGERLPDTPQTPTAAWAGDDCGDYASIIMKAYLKGEAPFPQDDPEVTLEINRYWAKAAVAAAKNRYNYTQPLDAERALPDLSALSGGKFFRSYQPSDTRERRLVDAIIDCLRREPTAEEWAAAGFPIA